MINVGATGWSPSSGEACLAPTDDVGAGSEPAQNDRAGLEPAPTVDKSRQWRDCPTDMINVGTGRDLSKEGESPFAPTNDVGATGWSPEVPPKAGLAPTDANIFNYIDQLYAKRLIDLDQASLYKIYALVKPDKLPAYLKGFDHKFMISATPIINEIFRNANLLSPKVIEEINSLLLPEPDDDDILLDSDKYPIRIHFPKEFDKLTFFTYDDILRYAEQTYETEVEKYGFIPPPPDYGFGGNDFYDIYMRDLNFAGGYTMPLGQYYGNDWYGMSSCCVVAILTYSFFGTIAHEFNHSCQFAADAFESSMSMESTATYIGTNVTSYSMAFNYYLINIFQQIPHKSIDYYDYDSWPQYGACIFLNFLCEYYDDGNPVFVRKIWDGCRQKNDINEPDFLDSITALVYDYSGDSFDDTYREFAKWRYFTSINDDGKHFKGGGLWGDETLVKIEKKFTIWNMPLKDFHPVNQPSEYGASYIVFDLKDKGGSLFLYIRGNPLKTWSADMILVPAEGTDTGYAEMEHINKSDGFLFIPDAGSYEKMVLVISNLSDGDHDPDNEDWKPSNYTLNAELVTEPKAACYLNQKVYFYGNSLIAGLALLNPGDLIDVDLVAALKVEGKLYFYPDWRPEFNKIEMSLDKKSMKTLKILEIDKIPETLGGNFTFFTALIDRATGEIIGDVSQTDFSINKFIPMVN